MGLTAGRRKMSKRKSGTDSERWNEGGEEPAHASQPQPYPSLVCSHLLGGLGQEDMSKS